MLSRNKEVVYFLAAPHHPEVHSPEARGSLITVKVSEKERPAYLAFRTSAQASRVIASQSGYYVIASTDLTPGHCADFSSRRILFLQTDEDVDQFLGNRATFPYKKHLVRFHA